MKNIIIASALMLLCYNGGAMAQKMVTIKGTVNGDLKGYNKVYIYGKETKTDSTTIVNGQFEFSFPFEHPVYPTMYSEYSRAQRTGYMIFGVLIDHPGTVYVKDIAIAQGLNSGKISGMSSAVDFQSFLDQQRDINASINKKIEEKFPAGNKDNTTASRATGVVAAASQEGAAPAQNASAATAAKGTGKKIFMATRTSMSPGAIRNTTGVDMKIFMRESDSLRNIMMPSLFEKFIQEHPDSYASAYALENQGRGNLAPSEMERLYATLSPKLKQSEAGIHISDYLKGLKSSLAGQHVEDFTLNTPEGKSIALSQLKGKYVLIDFWASWCAPCKASFPHMKEVYKKYKSDKFEIYSISIDKDKDAWLKELKKQELPWLQAIDTKNVSDSRFAVTGVPTTYMIDPEGKIIMKEVGFDSKGNSPMEKKLIELFGDKGTK